MGKYHCTIDLLFDWLGLVCFAKKIVIRHTADSKPVKQEVNGTVILPLLVFSDSTFHGNIWLGLKWVNETNTWSSLYVINYVSKMYYKDRLNKLVLHYSKLESLASAKH